MGSSTSSSVILFPNWSWPSVPLRFLTSSACCLISLTKVSLLKILCVMCKNMGSCMMELRFGSMPACKLAWTKAGKSVLVILVPFSELPSASCWDEIPVKISPIFPPKGSQIVPEGLGSRKESGHRRGLWCGHLVSQTLALLPPLQEFLHLSRTSFPHTNAGCEGMWNFLAVS